MHSCTENRSCEVVSRQQQLTDWTNDMVTSRTVLWCVLSRCYIVDDETTIIVSVEHDNRDFDSVSLKAKEPRAFTALLRGGVFIRRQRTNGVERCLARLQHFHNVSHHFVTSCLLIQLVSFAFSGLSRMSTEIWGRSRPVGPRSKAPVGLGSSLDA